MNHFEIQNCLDSMIILADRREQDTERARERYTRFCVPYKRCTLDYGDYTYNCRLPDGTWLYDDSETLKPDVVIERKMDLGELAQCYTWDRIRFQKEFDKAMENHSKVYLLVENATWENLLNGKYRSRYRSEAYIASVTAWMARYGTCVIFCKAESSGRMIKEILYRELKERLESEFYG